MITGKTKSVFRMLLWMMAVMLLILPYTAGAATNTISSLTSSFVRTSSTSAEAFIYATCNAPSKLVSAVTREIYDENEGDYVTDSRTYKKTMYNTTSITHDLILPVQATGDYRVRIQISDTYNEITTTVTSYAYLQEENEEVIPENRIEDATMALREEDML